MQVVKNILIALLVFWFALLLFMPKEELYYAVEKTLNQEGIEINEKEISTGLFSLTLKDVTVYVKGINIATVEEIDIFTLFVYSNVNVRNLIFDDSLSAFVPQNIEKSILMHSLLSPFEVFITTMGSFGLAEGIADLKTRKVRLDILDEKKMKSIRSQLKKDEKGLYYETSF